MEGLFAMRWKSQLIKIVTIALVIPGTFASRILADSSLLPSESIIISGATNHGITTTSHPVCGNMESEFFDQYFYVQSVDDVTVSEVIADLGAEPIYIGGSHQYGPRTADEGGSENICTGWNPGTGMTNEANRAWVVSRPSPGQPVGPSLPISPCWGDEATMPRTAAEYQLAGIAGPNSQGSVYSVIFERESGADDISSDSGIWLGKSTPGSFLDFDYLSFNSGTMTFKRQRIPVYLDEKTEISLIQFALQYVDNASSWSWWPEPANMHIWGFVNWRTANSFAGKLARFAIILPLDDNSSSTIVNPRFYVRTTDGQWTQLPLQDLLLDNDNDPYTWPKPGIFPEDLKEEVFGTGTVKYSALVQNPASPEVYELWGYTGSREPLENDVCDGNISAICGGSLIWYSEFGMSEEREPIDFSEPIYYRAPRAIRSGRLPSPAYDGTPPGEVTRYLRFSTLEGTCQLPTYSCICNDLGRCGLGTHIVENIDEADCTESTGSISPNYVCASGAHQNCSSSLIFQDGFESGDSSAWSG